jgi:hypothetical protein
LEELSFGILKPDNAFLESASAVKSIIGVSTTEAAFSVLAILLPPSSWHKKTA